MSCGCHGGCSHVAFVPNLSDYGKAFDRPGKKEIMRRRASGLGYLSGLGASPLVSAVAPKLIGLTAGTAVSAAIGTAAGTAGAIAFGAAAGSVVPVIGTVVGAVVGFLTTKLFGHANYAQVAASVSMQMQLAEAYKQVAGQYPGRVYGTQELHTIWWGLMHEGLFPKNPASVGWAPASTCNYTACIAGQRNGSGSCPGCGGNQRWVDDLFVDGIMTQLMGFGSRSLGVAAKAGLTNPIQICDQLYVPAWSGPDLGSIGIKWASPAGSTNPSLIRQLVIDTYDAALAANNPNLPIYYGALPGQPTSPVAVATPTAPVATVPPPIPATIMPVTTAQPVPVIGNTTTPPVAVVSPPTPVISPTNLPAGYTPTNITTTTGATVYSGPGGQGYYTLQNLGVVGMQMQPYQPNTSQVQPTPTAVSTLPVPALSPSTATGTITPDQVTALISQMQSQGATQTQQITAALQSLQSSGVAITPQVQSQVASQVATAPANTDYTPLILAGAGIFALMLFLKK